MLRLLELKRHPPDGIRDWRTFLGTALHNKGSNWIRDRQNAEKRLIALQTPLKASASADDDAPATLEARLSSPEADHDLRTAVAGLREELDPSLLELWDVLQQEAGNQVRAARRLRKHRNTVRLGIRRIQQALKRHGF